MKVFIEGLNIFFIYKNELLIFLFVLYGLGKMAPVTNGIHPVNKLGSALSAIPTGFVMLSGFTFLFSFAKFISTVFFDFLCFLLTGMSLLNLIYVFRTNEPKNNYINTVSVLVFFFICLLIKLPYLNQVLLPSYTDSPIHYQIIKNILEPTSLSPLMGIGSITKNYYHLGFHGVTAWFSGVTNTAPTKNMLLIGLLSLATAPISIAFITYVLSKNVAGALASGFITVFGWTMPAFALNWGKFPALLALSLIPTVIAWGALLLPFQTLSFKKVIFLSFMLASIVIVHSRSIFILASITVAFLVTNKLISNEILSYKKAFLYSVFFILSLLPLESTIAIFYNRFSLSVVLILLLPFGFRHFPKELSVLLIFIASIWFINFSGNFPSIDQPAYDAQFISMMMFIPISIATGLAISGVTKEFSPRTSLGIIGVFLLAVIYSSPWKASNYPDPCCNLYSEADGQAFQWIINNTPENALWIIAVAKGKQQHGTDAGIWISSLTNRNVNKKRYNSDWENESEFPHSCNSGTVDIYIYSSGRNFSFSHSDLLSLNWVKKVYENYSVKIYKILSCNK